MESSLSSTWQLGPPPHETPALLLAQEPPHWPSVPSSLLTPIIHSPSQIKSLFLHSYPTAYFSSPCGCTGGSSNSTCPKTEFLTFFLQPLPALTCPISAMIPPAIQILQPKSRESFLLPYPPCSTSKSSENLPFAPKLPGLALFSISTSITTGLDIIMTPPDNSQTLELVFLPSVQPTPVFLLGKSHGWRGLAWRATVYGFAKVSHKLWRKTTASSWCHQHG